MNKAIEKLDGQQKQYKDTQHGYWLCEQIKDICREEPASAELIAQDLDSPEMSVAACLKKLDAYAAAHKDGNRAMVPPQVAEKIIRKFYGLSERRQAPTSGEPILNASVPAEAHGEKPVFKRVSLLDFLEEEA